MKYFFIAGERSGDLHASNLIKELKRLDVDAECVGFGGDMMEAKGMTLLRHYSDFSFMGLWEVISHLGTIRSRLRECKKAIRDEQPDVLVLVDFPGFNLRMAAYAKSLGIKTCYYIAPKIWAWKKGRIKTIRKVVDKMLCILPFEVEFYKSLDFEVEYVGNPLMDAVRAYDFEPIEVPDKTIIGVLPGSRAQEVKAALPVVKEMAEQRPDMHFLVGGVDNLPTALYARVQNLPNVEIIYNRTYDILKVANSSMVTSGTATLEACLLSAPQVVVYRTSWLTYEIGRRVINVGFISLVNLIAGREVVKEMIQQDFNASSVLDELDKIVNDSVYCSTMLSNYQEVKEIIGYEPASKRTASTINDWLDKLKPPSTS